MADTLQPASLDQVLDAVRWAVSEEAPLDVRSGGTKEALGRPVQAAHTLDLSRLSGISDYQPGELNLTARAATPMADIIKVLDDESQELQFEPMDLGPLFGKAPGGGTIGGLVAANLSGPRRVKSGAARDHFLGFHAVSGRGEVFKSGGKVMKNVTGFDLSKLMAGSFGTLGVMSEVTLKVLPKAEKTRTVLIMGADTGAAAQAMSKALGSPHEISAAAALPASVAVKSAVGHVKEAGASVIAVRVEGPGPSVEYRAEALKTMLGPFGMVEELHSQNSAALWAEVRDAAFFTHDPATQVWRISTPPMEGPAIAGRLASVLGGEAYCDWGGGLIWLSIPAQDRAAREAVRAAIALCGGHATLIRASAGVRGAVDVFHDQGAAVQRLTARIKEAFDPKRVLNPGRMFKGI